MLKYNTLIFLFLFLQSCCTISKDEKIFNSILDSFAAQQKKEKNLVLIGLGGSMPEKIKSAFLHFISKEKVDVIQARKIYVECTQKLLRQINADEEVRPYLENYPFNYNNLDIMIRFEDKEGNHASDPNIALVSSANGDICYSTRNPTTNMLSTIYRESYEEALQIIQETDQH